MKVTKYFENEVMLKRTYLSIDACKSVINNPLKKEIQLDGRIRLWGRFKESDRYLRVVLLEDGETIHNAFIDRGFKPEVI